MIEPGWYLVFLVVVLAFGVMAGAVLGYAARRAGRSPAVIGWVIVATLFALGWAVGDRTDRAFLVAATVVALLGWPLGGIIGERAFLRFTHPRRGDARHHRPLRDD